MERIKSLYLTTKTILILLYLFFIFLGGFTNLIQNNAWYAHPFHPWSNWSFFSTYGRLHGEIAAYGTKTDGIKIGIPMRDMFPMSHSLIERGGAVSLYDALNTSSQLRRFLIAEKLCRYILKKHNEAGDEALPRLRSVEIKIRKWALDKKEEQFEDFLTTCYQQ